MPIRKLPTLLVNQIAAGEVIDRPAGAVKELLENSIDAGASRIDVAIEEGGRQLIRVTDDGGGMSPEDLALAFEPHATSKIAEVDDLFRIGTLGFRGEALASIGAVSDARIVSRRPGDESAHEITCHADRLGEVRPAAGPVGTTIEVRNLFFNTPARRKFLKSDTTEFGHIAEAVLRIALPHPAVAFRLTHNGKKVYDLPASRDTRERIAELLGADSADGLIPLVGSEAGVRLTGWAAPPADSRANDRGLYLFLNGRFVRDRLLTAAVREAYRGMLEVHRKPVAYLFFDMDPAEVDVNVHPTKTEVRFRNGNAVYRLTLHALRAALLGTDLAPTLKVPAHATEPNGSAPPLSPSGEPFAPPPDFFDVPTSVGTETASLALQARENAAPPDPLVQARQDRVREAVADFFKSLDPVQARIAFTPHPRRDPPGLPSEVEGSELKVESSQALPRPTSVRAEVDNFQLSTLQPSTAARRAVQLHNSFIVAETPDGLVIVDQHALHERILYEQLKGRVAGGGLAGQRLLIPETIEMSASRREALAECRALLGSMGIEVDDFGNGTAAVQSFPAMLRRAKPAEFVAGVLDAISDREGRAGPEELLHACLDMAACKAAVKAGDRLTPDEIDGLLALRETVEQHQTCAHGRPTTLKLTVRELERQFKRH
jgi:DNA mismatch repair protein MutL